MGGNMRLRNKKTGEIASTSGGDVDLFILDEFNRIVHETYSSLAELNEDWEDYKPKEPLIKDEKIRKALRTWADLNGIDKVVYDELTDDCETYFFEDEGGHISIQNFDYIYELQERKLYTITELCGEEE